MNTIEELRTKAISGIEHENCSLHNKVCCTKTARLGAHSEHTTGFVFVVFKCWVTHWQQKEHVPRKIGNKHIHNDWVALLCETHSQRLDVGVRCVI